MGTLRQTWGQKGRRKMAPGPCTARSRGSLRVACGASSGTATTNRSSVAQKLPRTSWVTKKLNQHRTRIGGNSLLRTKALEEGSDDVDFEERLAKLRAAKGTGARPGGLEVEEGSRLQGEA